MSNSLFHVAVLDNGITLLGQENPNASSAGFSFLFPFGSSTDLEGLWGISNLLAEMTQKGSKNFTQKEILDKLESYGISKSVSPSKAVTLFSFFTLEESLIEAIKLSSELILNPSFPLEELESVKKIAIQELDSLEDNPSSKVMTLLSKHLYLPPYNMPLLGSKDTINKVSMDDLKSYYKKVFVPDGVIVAVVGKFNWELVKETFNLIFGSWSGKSEGVKTPSLNPKSSYTHYHKDSSQVQIAFSYPSSNSLDDDYYVAKVANGILSSGMCGRLFVEVREKRGLVYRVSSSHSVLNGIGSIILTAGTTKENVKETFDVMLKECKNLSNGVSEEELSRAKVDLKTELVMQNESSISSSGSMLSDWWHFRKKISILEKKKAIDKVTREDIYKYLEKYPLNPLISVTLGPSGL